MSAGSKGEELVMDTFNQEFRDKGIRVVGGTAYESPDGRTSFVALNGVVYTNTCVFALIHNMNGKIFDYRENKFFGITLLPAGFMTSVCVTYILCDKIGFRLPVEISSICGVLTAIGLVILFVIKHRKLQDKQ